MLVSENSLQRRKVLSGLMKLLVLIGLIFVSIPFISSFTSSDASTQKITSDWIITHPVTDFVSGEVTIIPWAGGVVWVYRRTENDILSLAQHHILRDVFSDKSEQPLNMKNDIRSADEKYFVFIPLENKRNCQVRLDKNTGTDGELSLFTEPCYGAKYDAAGRILKNTGQPEQTNLPVPEHIIDAGLLKVGIWTPKIK